MLRNTIRSVAALVLIAVVWPSGWAALGGFDGQPIFVQNDTNRTIWVAIRYIPTGASSYITDGFWSVKPGQRQHLINNGVSGIIYIHAHDDQGVMQGQGTPIHQTVRGHAVELYPEYPVGDAWTIRFHNRR